MYHSCTSGFLDANWALVGSFRLIALFFSTTVGSAPTRVIRFSPNSTNNSYIKIRYCVKKEHYQTFAQSALWGNSTARVCARKRNLLTSLMT